MNTLGDCWYSYLTCVIPDDAPDIQVEETKRAFYAGAYSALTMINTLASKNLEKEEEVKRFNDLVVEINEFVKTQNG